MQKKILISLGLIAMIGLTTVQAMANSTIYTDELGRMHFLGKDPEAKTLQKLKTTLILKKRMLQMLLTDLEISIDMMLKDITM